MFEDIELVIKSHVVSETMSKPVAHCMNFDLDLEKAGVPASPVDEKDSRLIRFHDQAHVLLEKQHYFSYNELQKIAKRS